MGSDSDLPAMSAACKCEHFFPVHACVDKPNACRILDHFQVRYEVTIVSAHRTPQRLMEYAHSAAERGLKVRHA